MSNIVVDDTDPSLTYSGQWTLLAGGSSRQWNSTVHSTFQSGATVSFQFQGSVCKVYGTVPVGNGSTVLMDVTIDGSVSPIVSQTSGSAAIYADLFYQSSSMSSSWHTVVITNKGGAGNLDFEFDRVELDASDIVPTIASFIPTSVLNPTSTGVSIATTGRPVSTQSTAAAPSTPPSTSSTTSPTVPVTTVIGIVGGIIALLILLSLLFLCHRRLKAKNHRFTAMGVSGDDTTRSMSQNRTTVPIPFIRGPSSAPSATGLNAALDSPSRIPLFSALSAKAVRQRPKNDLAAASNPTLSSVSAHGTGGISNVEALTSKRLLLDLPPLGGSPVSSPPAAADANNLRNLSGSASVAGPLMSAHGGVVRVSDVPPAYRPNE